MYDKIKSVTGWAAIFVGFGYIVWAVIATTDGAAGIEIPINVIVVVMTTIILLAFTSIGMRVGQWAAQYVVNALVSDHFDLLVNAVVSKLEGHHRHLQQMVKAEVAAAMREVSEAAFRSAVVRQASDAAEAARADADADASITHINGRR